VYTSVFNFNGESQRLSIVMPRINSVKQAFERLDFVLGDLATASVSTAQDFPLVGSLFVDRGVFEDNAPFKKAGRSSLLIFPGGGDCDGRQSFNFESRYQGGPLDFFRTYFSVNSQSVLYSVHAGVPHSATCERTSPSDELVSMETSLGLHVTLFDVFGNLAEGPSYTASLSAYQQVGSWDQDPGEQSLATGETDFSFRWNTIGENKQVTLNVAFADKLGPETLVGCFEAATSVFDLSQEVLRLSGPSSVDNKKSCRDRGFRYVSITVDSTNTDNVITWCGSVLRSDLTSQLIDASYCSETSQAVSLIELNPMLKSVSSVTCPAFSVVPGAAHILEIVQEPCNERNGVADYYVRSLAGGDRFRADGRCGPLYPAAGAHVGECDPNGPTPICSEAGECTGSGPGLDFSLLFQSGLTPCPSTVRGTELHYQFRLRDAGGNIADVSRNVPGSSGSLLYSFLYVDADTVNVAIYQEGIKETAHAHVVLTPTHPETCITPTFRAPGLPGTYTGATICVEADVPSQVVPVSAPFNALWGQFCDQIMSQWQVLDQQGYLVRWSTASVVIGSDEKSGSDSSRYATVLSGPTTATAVDGQFSLGGFFYEQAAEDLGLTVYATEKNSLGTTIAGLTYVTSGIVVQAAALDFVNLAASVVAGEGFSVVVKPTLGCGSGPAEGYQDLIARILITQKDSQGTVVGTLGPFQASLTNSIITFTDLSWTGAGLIEVAVEAINEKDISPAVANILVVAAAANRLEWVSPMTELGQPDYLVGAGEAFSITAVVKISMETSPMPTKAMES